MSLTLETSMKSDRKVIFVMSLVNVMPSRLAQRTVRHNHNIHVVQHVTVIQPLDKN
jgi:hypothetical protein